MAEIEEQEEPVDQRGRSNEELACDEISWQRGDLSLDLDDAHGWQVTEYLDDQRRKR